MRTVLLLLLTAALGYGLWVLIDIGGDSGRPSSPEDGNLEDMESPEQRAARDREIRRYGRKTGTLTVRARTTDGEVPAGLEVGYIRADDTVRWLYADDNNARTFTDAPLGRIRAVARATGYPQVEQDCQVIADVPCSAVLLLSPAPASDNEGPGR